MQIILAKPRGFCAGVTRAIETVELAIKKFGTPVYVRHEIVHNKFVVDDLKNKGAIFVDEINQIPLDASAVVFSAHGVSDAVEKEAKQRGFLVIDATCPLVSKVHRSAKQYEELGYQIILIGHKGHPEVEGTSGRVKKPIILVTSEEEAKIVEINPNQKTAFVTQTTLSVDETNVIVRILQQRFSNIENAVATKDICYATQNRQDAVREIAKNVDLILVVGSQNSSNSNRLRDLAEKSGVKAFLIENVNDLQESWFVNIDKVGITAGASAPEVLVQALIEKIRLISCQDSRQSFEVADFNGVTENVVFALPRQVRNG